MSTKKTSQSDQTRHQDEALSLLERLLSGQAGPLPIDSDVDCTGSSDDGLPEETFPASPNEEEVGREAALFIDPWLRKQTAIRSFPPDRELLFVCSYGVHLGVDAVDEEAYWRRTDRYDELWIRTDWSGSGCGVRAPRRNDGELPSCLFLLDVLFRARIGSGWPDRFLEKGVVDKDDFDQLCWQIKQDLDGQAALARQEVAAQILETARELGLCPRPTGTGPHHWQAGCPGTNHHFYLHSGSNTFGCGYCKKKGGPAELREFVALRKARTR